MKYYRLLLIIATLLCLAGIGVGWVLIHADMFNLCEQHNRVCEYNLSFNFGEPLVFSLLPILPVLILFIFLPKAFTHVWIKFVAPYCFLGILWVVYTPSTCPALICINKETAAWFFGFGFLGVSLCVVVWQLFSRARGGASK